MTWNWANTFADGALEERNAGLTSYGERLIRKANKTGHGQISPIYPKKLLGCD
ncbi:membrane dipeptidase [Bacillus licheniformis]|nr:membrane dipeptidase [Bacillus licheniformis]